MGKAKSSRSFVSLRMTTTALGMTITVACSPSAATTASTPARGAIAPELNAITEGDIRRDIFALGGDAMRGREAGTLDEMRATGWVAERAREAGLTPAGE